VYLYSGSSRLLIRGASDRTKLGHDDIEWSSTTCEIETWKVEEIQLIA